MKKEVADKAVRFIIENAQKTTSENFCVYGTLTPEDLDEFMKAIPKGQSVFAKATERRNKPKPRLVCR